MTDTPTPGAQTTTLQVMSYNAQTDAHTLVLDLNDHGAFTLRPQGLVMAQPPKVDSRSSNLRVPGERVVKWQYKNRHITVQLNLRALTPSDSTSTTQLLTDVRNLLAAVEHPPYELRIALPKATQYSYADVVQCTHTIPSDPQEILAGAIRTVAIDFECLPGLRGDRVTLQNLVFNPGFEAPSGPAVTAFSDTFANFNAYTVQAGGALVQDSTYYADVVLADSPLMWYRLDETSGTTVYDAGSLSNNGTTHGSPTQNVTGLLNGDPDTCYTFAAASSQYVSLGTTTGLPTGATAFSFEAWYKFGSITGTIQTLWWLGKAVANNVAWLYVDTTGRATFGSDGGTTLTSSVLSTGVAHHIVGTYDGTQMRLYVDGALVAGPTAETFAITYSSGAANLGATVTPNQFANGQIDEAAIYTGALSAAQVTAHYNAGHNAPVANQARTMVVPSGGRVSFGSPAWGSLNTWQTRFRFAASLTGTWYLHYTDASNYLAAVVTQTALTLNHVVSGTTHQLTTANMNLVPGIPYWLVVTQFPTVSGNSAMVQAQIFADLTGILMGNRSNVAVSALVGPVGSFDAVTALSGAPQIAASGAALALGGAAVTTSGHSVALFRPGGWTFTSAGTGAAALGTDTATTFPNGPVTSVHAARITAPPAGTLDATLLLYPGGTPANTNAIPVSAAGDVLYAQCVARSSGLGNGAAVSLDYSEYDTNGNFLRNGTLQTLTISGGGQIAWPAAGAASLAGHWTTGASCAYVDLHLHVVDSVAANSAGASVWFDNAQCWDATTTGTTSMSYHELNFPMTPAQVMVSGLLGDMETPCLFAFGAFWSSFAPANAATLAVGRRAQASAGALLVGAPVNFYGSGAVTTPVLDSTSYSGYNIQATVTSAGWNPRGFSAHPSDLLGTYHLWNRFKSGQSAGNLANVQQRIATFMQTDAWIGLSSGTDLLGVYYGLWNAPLAASATWTVCDAGQVAIPPFNLGAATDATQNYVTPRPQVQDLTGGGSTCAMSWELLLPVDASLMLATVNNPSNSPITITNGYLWCYFDGLGVLQGNPATWSYSQESSALPNAAHSSGGNGTTSSGTLNVNPTADTLLTLDPSQKVAGVAVNQFAMALSDATGLSAASLAQIQYTPLYLYPR